MTLDNGITTNSFCLDETYDKENVSRNFPRVGFLTDDKIRDLTFVLGYEIKNPAIFEQALTHRSYLPVLEGSGFSSYERLEFLGDSILNFVVSDWLFEQNEHDNEGELTVLRSRLVNKKSLADCAKKLKIDEFIMLSFSAEKSLKSGSISILADIIEALVAAVYLDSDFSSAANFIKNVLLRNLLDSSANDDNNYKTKLLELVQSEGKKYPSYNVLDEYGPDHKKIFVVGVYVDEVLVGTGIGKNKKEAEQNAAQNALLNNYSKFKKD